MRAFATIATVAKQLSSISRRMKNGKEIPTSRRGMKDRGRRETGDEGGEKWRGVGEKKRRKTKRRRMRVRLLRESLPLLVPSRAIMHNRGSSWPVATSTCCTRAESLVGVKLRRRSRGRFPRERSRRVIVKERDQNGRFRVGFSVSRQPRERVTVSQGHASVSVYLATLTLPLSAAIQYSTDVVHDERTSLDESVLKAREEAIRCQRLTRGLEPLHPRDRVLVDTACCSRVTRQGD